MIIPGFLASFVLSFGLLIMAMSAHEFSHGWVAYRLGDMTAKRSGRLTLNPLAHIDPVWTLLMPLLLFISTKGQFVLGAAKPVPINYLALKNPKRDIIWIGLSGPAANFILAGLFSIILRLIQPPAEIHYIVVNFIIINVVLGVFNLIPIPPLDGSRMLMGILPAGMASRYAYLEPFGFLIVMLLLWLGILGRIIWPMIHFILLLLRVSS